MRRKTLYLIRGLPGSGKSTLAQDLEELAGTKYGEVSSISTDDFFTGGTALNFAYHPNAWPSPNEYRFDKELIDEAHSAAQDFTLSSLEADLAVVIVHNTFSQPWEAEPYIEMARRFGYEIFVIETQNRFGSTHGVNGRIVDNMRSRWLPLM